MSFLTLADAYTPNNHSLVRATATDRNAPIKASLFFRNFLFHFVHNH